MTTSLLLDFDGVVLKNRNLHNYQLRRSAKFVQKHTNYSLRACEELNKVYYPTYGHTVTMVNKLFNQNTTLEDYNDFVFDKKELVKLDRLLDLSTVEHMKSFEKIIRKCTENPDELNWRIFTNAHINWITHFCVKVGLHDYSEDKVIWPTELNFLKPNEDAYVTVENKLTKTDMFIFIDDSWVNLEAAQERDGWQPILMKDNTEVEFVYNECLDLHKNKKSYMNKTQV